MSRANHLIADRFEGNAFSPGSSSKVLRGEIQINLGNLDFVSEAARISLPIQGLVIRAGGYNNSQIFFEHPNQPGWNLFTTQTEILKHPALAHLVDKKLATSGARTHKRFVTLAITSILLVVGLIGLGFGTIALQKDSIVRAVANKIPVEKEIELGDKLFDQAKSGWTFVQDPAMNETLSQVTNKFQKIMASSPYPLKFYIIHDTNVNAFAMPGGNIVVHDALILKFNDVDAVAGVIAHEIAHVTERHSLRRLIESSGLYLLLQAFLGNADMLISIARDGSQLLLERKFSRNFEREADNRGWEYMIEAGIDPQGMINGFKKLKAEAERAGQGNESKALAWLSTHGSIDARIKNLEDKLKDKAPTPE